MKSKFSKEIITAIVFVVLTLLLINPFNFWMLNMVVMYLLAGFIAVFALYVVFMLREKVADERDISHRALSGRVAFLAGSLILIAGITFQAIWMSGIDEWLVLSLLVMILAKLITRIYSDRNM